MSNNKMLVKVNKRKNDGLEVYEGTVTVVGLRPSKLTKLKSEDTQFNTRSSLASSARSLGKRLGLEVEFVDTEKTTTKSRKPTTQETFSV